MQLEGYTLEFPNLKRSSHAQYFGILKKTHIFTRRIVFAIHDAIFSHTFIKINKQLKLNVLLYTLPVFTIHIECLSNYQY